MNSRIGFYELLALVCIGALVVASFVGEVPAAQRYALAVAALTFAVLHAGDHRL